MSVPTKMTVNGSIVEDYKNLNVTRSMGDSNAASSFEAILDSPFGRHRNDYTVGNEVIVYTGSGYWTASGGLTGNYSNLGSTLIGSQVIGSTFAIADTGLFAYYKLNENAANTTVTDYVGSHHGVNSVNTSNYSSGGILGSCFAYGAGSTVLASGLKMTIPFSVSMWTKTSADGEVLSKRVTGAGHYNYDMRIAGSQIMFFQDRSAGSRYATGSSTTLRDGSWHHIVGIGSSNGIIVYHNGSLDGFAGNINADKAEDTAYQALIGTNSLGASVGNIDDVRIYSYALPVGSIAAIYNSGVPTEYTNYTNNYFNDYSQNLSGLYISQTGSSVIGSQMYNATTIVPFNSGLINYWAFDTLNGSVVSNLFANSSSGLICSGATYTTGIVSSGGLVGSAISFGGSSYIQINQPIAGSTTGSYTISMWVKTGVGNTGTGDSANAVIVGDGQQFLMAHNNGYVPQFFAGGWKTSTGSIAKGVWTHEAWVTSAGSTTLYLQGASVWSINSAKTLFTSGVIGQRMDFVGPQYAYSGLIDDVRIYNYPMNSTEIAQIYKNGSPTVYASGVSYISGGVVINDYTNIYTGSVTNIGSYLLGSQVINAGSINIGGTYDSGLKMYYKFNELTGSPVDSAGAFTGRIMGTVNQGVSGIIGSCIEFSGAGYVYSSLNSTAGNYTFSMWINPIAYAAPGDESVGFDSLAGRFLLYTHGGGGSPLSMGFYDGTVRKFNVLMNLGSWTHYTWVLDTATAKGYLYVNGSVQATQPAYTTKNLTGSTTLFGNYIGANPFYGKVDDFRFYEYAMTAGSVQAIYNARAEYVSGTAIYGSSGGTTLYNYDYLYNGSYIGIPGSALVQDKLFTGILEKKVYTGEETTQELTLSGRDYTARLQDLTVEPIVFSNTEISNIVLNIMGNNGVQDITVNNVNNTGIILKRIGFNQTPIFDALTQLAQLAGFVFYIDTDKDLHFEKAQNISTGVTFDNTNLMTCDFDKSREGMANKIWVYGDRYLAEAPNETFRFGSPVGLSGVTLNYKPHNTRVSYLGSVLKGSIQGMTAVPTSGEQYGVSYDDRNIVFYSGTYISYSSIPASGGSVVIAYDRSLPIVKYGQDDNSIALYGPKVLKIQDNSIKDPQTAMDILQNKLENTDPLDRVRCKVKGWYNLTPSNTVSLQLDNFNLNAQPQIVELNYKFDKETIQNEEIINATLSNKFIDITDKLKELKNKIDALETQNLQDTDVLTRLVTNNDSVQVVGSRWNVYIRTVAGDVGVYNSPIYGLYNTAKYVGNTATTFTLGDATRGKLGTVPLGANLGSWRLIASGGYYW